MAPWMLRLVSGDKVVHASDHRQRPWPLGKVKLRFLEERFKHGEDDEQEGRTNSE